MSSTKDLHIFESGSGGELAKIQGDLVLVESLFQVVYISLFGGNVEASTLGNELDSQERKDYWANALIFPNKPSRQFNSETEKTLTQVPLNSEGRLKIESAIKLDLDFLKNIANLQIEVNISSLDKVDILITLDSITNQTNQQFQFIWDNSKKQVITQKII